MTRDTQLLKPEQLAELRRLLAERRVALARLVQSEHEKIRDGSIADPHEQSADATRAAEFIEMQTAMTDRHLVEINAIERAESRLAEGTYGECATCGGPIGYERLTAYPTAERCTPCQSAYERRSGRDGHPHL